jgi:hypothetical protein
MGWKNVKEGYKIAHAVCVTEEGICIGSAYIHDIIVIGQDGTLKKRYSDRSNEDLKRYQSEMDSDPVKLAKLVQSKDTFQNDLVVYTYHGGDIIEKRCDALGWPNVTHDGDMMYDNTFSSDKAKVVKWAKENALAGVEIYERRIQDERKNLAELEDGLAKSKKELSKLNAYFPAT